MFNFFRKKTPLILLNNPGTTHIIENKNFGEINLVDMLYFSLKAENYRVKNKGDYVYMPDSGLQLLPKFVNSQLSDSNSGTILTTVTIQFHHSKKFPGGSFEFIHGFGLDFQAAIKKGFSDWCVAEYLVLHETFANVEPRLTHLVVPHQDNIGNRRIVLGPITYLADPVVHHSKENLESLDTSENQDHPAGCPCCLLTNTFETFKPWIEESLGFAAFRFFISRSKKGEFDADCRINGIDIPEGREALINYAKTWSGTDLEFRKQYIVVRSEIN